MKASILFFTATIIKYWVTSSAPSSKLLNFQNYRVSNAMEQVMDRVINENSYVKDGFLYVSVNYIEPELSTHAIKKITENSTVVIINFNTDFNVTFLLNPNHFKFVLADPEGDLSQTDDIFKKVGVSRARTVLILTKKPPLIFINYILNWYWKIQCINVVVAYESEGKVEMITYNPYLSTSQKIEHLTNSTNDLFYDKTRNLHGYRVRCLLTYLDRTKIKRISTDNGFRYQGKDYNAMQTIISHLNGEMVLVTMENILLNPWFESIDLGDRVERKKKILHKLNIDLLIKSERFSIDDDVLDNLYPHTQNDLSSLVPKSSEIPFGKSMIESFSSTTFIMNIFMTIVLLLFWIATKKFFWAAFDIERMYFDILRIIITNSLARLPRNYIERLLLVSWIFNCFLINIVLQSKITSYLAIRTYYPEINTIEELFSSGLPLYSINIYIEEIKKKYAGTQYESYAESLIPLTSNEGLMDLIIYRADVSQMPAFFTEHDLALFVSRCENYRKNGEQVYHLVKESFIPNYQTYKIVHNSPLLPILNKKLRSLSEGGFVELWAKNVIYNATVEGFLYPEDKNNMRNATPMSLEECIMWFYIMFAGYSLSVVVLIIEIIFYKKTECKIYEFVN